MNELVSEILEDDYTVDSVYLDFKKRKDVYIVNNVVKSNDKIIATGDYDHDLMILLK